MAWILWILPRGFPFSRVHYKIQNNRTTRYCGGRQRLAVGVTHIKSCIHSATVQCAVRGLEEIRGNILGLRFRYGFRGRTGYWMRSMTLIRWKVLNFEGWWFSRTVWQMLLGSALVEVVQEVWSDRRMLHLVFRDRDCEASYRYLG